MDEHSDDAEQDFAIQRRNLVALCIFIFVFHSGAISVSEISAYVIKAKISSIAYWRGFMLVSLIYITVRYAHAFMRTKGWGVYLTDISVWIKNNCTFPGWKFYCQSTGDEYPKCIFPDGEKGTITLYISTKRNPPRWHMQEIVYIDPSRKTGRRVKENQISPFHLISLANKIRAVLLPLLPSKRTTIVYFIPFLLAFLALLELLSVHFFNWIVSGIGAFLDHHALCHDLACCL